MPRLAPCLILLMLAAGCDRSTDPLVAPTTDAPDFAAAGKSVDPAALTPAPALVGAQAECRADGQWILCHTVVTFELANEPVFDLPCGTIYETSTDVRLGTRWYDAADSVIVKRHVRQDLEGSWSLSPDGTARRSPSPCTPIGTTPSTPIPPTSTAAWARRTASSRLGPPGSA